MTDKANSRGRLLTDEIDEMLRQMLEELVASGDFEAKLNDKGERVYRMTDLGQARLARDQGRLQ
jgi:hypothetical protein